MNGCEKKSTEIHASQIDLFVCFNMFFIVVAVKRKTRSRKAREINHS